MHWFIRLDHFLWWNEFFHFLIFTFFHFSVCCYKRQTLFEEIAALKICVVESVLFRGQLHQKCYLMKKVFSWAILKSSESTHIDVAFDNAYYATVSVLTETHFCREQYRGATLKQHAKRCFNSFLLIGLLNML